MDVDWCLSCERRIDGLDSTTGPYCSPECLSFAQPSSSSRIHAPPPSSPAAYRIRQWAEAIPAHVPAGAPAKPFSDSLAAPRPAPFDLRPPPTPKLIERTSVPTPLPTHCVSSPAYVRPLPPARTSSRTYANTNTTPNTPATVSEASTSLTTLLSEPMVATPDEDCCFGSGIGALVRSLVHRDNTRSTKPEAVVEKVTDYFPPPPNMNKSHLPSPSSTKSKKTKPPSPTSSSRQKQPPKKSPHGFERDTSTPTHHTPVVFPSCRAAELDWDDGEDDQDNFVSPQPRYQPKYEPQRQYLPSSVRRTSSPTPSVSSTESSVLLMAPKRRDGIRGRKQARINAA